jgi:hypothetical protein
MHGNSSAVAISCPQQLASDTISASLSRHALVAESIMRAYTACARRMYRSVAAAPRNAPPLKRQRRIIEAEQIAGIAFDAPPQQTVRLNERRIGCVSRHLDDITGVVQPDAKRNQRVGHHPVFRSPGA